jgi:hypothetical protein
MTLNEGRKRLVDVWIESLDKNEPEIDRARGRDRVLAAQRAIERRQERIVWLRPIVVAAAMLVLAVGLAKFWPRTTTFTVAGQRGEVGEWLATAASEQLALDFSEGTHVALEGGSRGRVEQVTRHGARVEIERGSLNAHVNHLTGAAWRFGAGPFEVVVTGTNLAVNWSPEGGKFELSVQRGSVVVRGPYIDTPLEVKAGERCRVDLNSKSVELEQVARTNAPSEPPPKPDTRAAETEAPSADPTAPRARTQAAPSWIALERDGNHDEAIAMAERTGLRKIYQTAQADELLDLAHAARLSGRADIERASLLACRKRYHGETAARAAYYLGMTASPRDAARWFETYLDEQPKGMLAREAAGRLIESYQRAGDGSAARRAATGYLATYPDGPHAALARQVLGR